MFKKLMLLAMAVGVLVAFAVPAAAQATVQLTNENEEPLAEGAPVTAVSSNLVTTLEGGGQLECASVDLHLEVGTNGPNHVTLTQTEAATTTGCFINLGALGKFAATITDGTLGFEEGNEITLGTTGTGVTNARFGSDVPALGLNCTQTGKVHVQGTNGTNVLDVTPSKLTPTGTNCRAGTIEGAFTLSSEGSPIVIDHS